MKYIYLILAITFEVSGTFLLPATQSFTKLVPTILLIIFYLTSFYFLSITIKYIPLSIVYASWTGLGVFFVTLFSYFIYKEKISWEITLGLFFIILGVIIINYYKNK